MYAFNGYVFPADGKNFVFVIAIQYRCIDPYQANGFGDYDITFFVDPFFLAAQYRHLLHAVWPASGFFQRLWYCR